MRSALPAPRAGLFSGVSNAWQVMTDPHHRTGRLITLALNLPAYGRYYARLRRSQYGQVIVRGDPFFDRKFVTPYLATFFTAAQRLTIQSHLCHLFDTAFCLKAFVPQVRNGLVLWQSGSGDTHQDITLRLPVRTMLEGDLTLDYRLGGERLYRLSFAFVPGVLLGMTDAQVAFIGGSQGVRGTAEKVRQAAQMNGEINAASLLLIALKAICQNLGISSICGVEAAAQPVVHAEPEAHVSVYDQLWQKNHGERRDGFYLMPAATPDDDSVAGGHKSRTRRKRRRKQALLDDMTQTFKACVAVQPQVSSEVISLKVPTKLNVTPLSAHLTTA
ncbi:DUF535 family protein [Asticcacaulis sp. 201]|uniref:DUF535 family protein n=1 Tax=Asticcacaulis sp. 201 TaxID=3028787 RepID=UPI0029170F4E|nr:DUF535 family protein [Asticcacaulis sp. 201]MDV6332476.1 DUF535 family protein [Asticcacaulis sp. 201]